MATNRKLIAVIVLGLLTIINCLGVRLGTLVQSGLTVLKILAIAGLVGSGWVFAAVGYVDRVQGAQTVDGLVGSDQQPLGLQAPGEGDDVL